MATIIRAGDCYPSEQLGIGTTAIGLSTSCYNPTTGDYAGMVARAAMINAETDDIRFHIRTPALSPAAACGMILMAGDYLFLDSVEQLQNFRCINTTAGHSSTGTVFFYF
jgi:hypothetical protein